MSGLSNSEKMTFVNFFRGLFTVEVKPETHGAETRTTETGRIVHYKSYNQLEGYIRNIEKKTRDFQGKTYTTLQIIIEDDLKFCLQLNYFGNPARCFFNVLPNIDLGQKVHLIAKRVKQDDTSRDVLFVNQNGKGLKWYYTKEDPKGKPDWKKLQFNGKTEWDRTEELDFFQAYIDTVVKQTLKDLTPIDSALNFSMPTPAEDNDDCFGNESLNDDDLPF